MEDMMADENVVDFPVTAGAPINEATNAVKPPHACVSFVGFGQVDDPMSSALTTLTYPMCRIAEKLGVSSIPYGATLPSGVWISDGSGSGAAYNFLEIIDKMTERMSR